RFTGGFNYFVASIIAPVAFGWSDSRVGFSPTGKSAALSRRTPIADAEILADKPQNSLSN
ncbi:hypothetical protein, partial [Cellvibrio sp. NN19]|uniref:hypothetical protein n=1 Tax=Cellvibrio chitinivorans TaxID=3102792 RepID=UPI002B4155B6